MIKRYSYQRREFITLIGASAVGWPFGAYAQHPPTPVIGFISSSTPSRDAAEFTPLLNAFHEGLNEGGYVEGRNVAIEYRWAGGRYDRLPALAADLARLGVKLIAATGGLPSALAAKAATNTIPILFIAGGDPVQFGLVTSLSRPSDNATGVGVYTTDLALKRLELLRRLIPGLATVALLVNADSNVAKFESQLMEHGTRSLGLKLLVLEAHVENDFEAEFALAVQQGAEALLVSADPFFTNRRIQLTALAARHKLPTCYPWREYVKEGGLMSYGPTLAWAYHQLGLYASRILSGAKPSDLPVQLPTRFELVVNLKTAKALGLTVPPIVLVSIDEFIE